MQPIININYRHHLQEINEAIEGEILKAVVDVGVMVDKDRLIKAITDAKSFWQEGYNAGRPTAKWESIIDRNDVWGDLEFHKCSRCNQLQMTATNYCPDCGAEMESD